jgi:GntR family transcriptional regulator
MTTPPLYINPSDELPIFRQLIRQITDAIAGGHLRPGDRLPSHRELASQLVIAPLTVKKAYDELEREGLIGTKRGKGTFVSMTPPARDPMESRERLRDAAQRLVSQAALSGVPLPDVVDLLEDLWKRMKS